MRKNLISLIGLSVLCLLLLAGCSSGTTASQTSPTTPATEAAVSSEESAALEDTCPLADGVYLARFDTDSSMFHINESMDGCGILTVENGKMVIHITLPSKHILNLFPGTAEEAQREGAVLLEPTLDPVTYSDGWREEVNGFDVPVPYLDEEFDCALIGTKGTWYDHKVSVSDVREYVPAEENVAENAPEQESGMTVEVTLSGGSGRASVASPCALEKDENGQYWVTVVWSSKNYEFMLVDGVQYDPIQEEGNSTFRIPVQLDEDMPISAQTVAMSEPHLVDYTLHFDGSTVKGE